MNVHAQHHKRANPRVVYVAENKELQGLLNRELRFRCVCVCNCILHYSKVRPHADAHADSDTSVQLYSGYSCNESAPLRR